MICQSHTPHPNLHPQHTHASTTSTSNGHYLAFVCCTVKRRKLDLRGMYTACTFNVRFILYLSLKSFGAVNNHD